MNTLACWDNWPLQWYAWDHRERATVFELPIDGELPIEAQEALKNCGWHDKDVVIAWISDDFAVVETLEPLDDDDEKQELTDLNIDWRSKYQQSLDIVVRTGLSHAQNEKIKRHLDRISEDATKIAEESLAKLSQSPRLPLYVLDDRHVSLSTVVLFSVSPVYAVEAARNRAFVKSWAKVEFEPLFQLRIQSLASKPVFE